MTDIELTEDTEEKKESGYAKLRASLKEKYEGQINDLQSKISELEAANASAKKSFFNQTLNSQGYQGDFSEFADKYSNLGVDEMVALYKGMNGIASPTSKEEIKEEKATDLGPKSVIGSNPTTTVSGDNLDQMSGDDYLKYLKSNMSKLGLG